MGKIWEAFWKSGEHFGNLGIILKTCENYCKFGKILATNMLFSSIFSLSRLFHTIRKRIFRNGYLHHNPILELRFRNKQKKVKSRSYFSAVLNTVIQFRWTLGAFCLFYCIHWKHLGCSQLCCRSCTLKNIFLGSRNALALFPAPKTKNTRYI